MFHSENQKGAGMVEYGLMVALITVVALVAVWALADAYLSIGQDAPDRAQSAQAPVARAMLLKSPIPCDEHKEAIKGGLQLTTHRLPTDQHSIHGVSWCSGDGDGSHEIGNSLNKLSVKYPFGMDPSDVNKDSVSVRLDKDGDGDNEKDATEDVSGVTANGSNLVITLTGNYNIDKHDSITFVYTGVEHSSSGSNRTVQVSINGDAPDAGDETQYAEIE